MRLLVAGPAGLPRGRDHPAPDRRRPIQNRNPRAHPEQLRPGDVLFVAGSDGTAENPGHEGMYIGDQLIVEAPHPGASVHLTPLTAYWTADLHARRLIAGR